MFSKRIAKKIVPRFKSPGPDAPLKPSHSKSRTKTPLNPIYSKQDFGSLQTNYEAPVAIQRLNKEHLIKERFVAIKDLQAEYINEFNRATEVSQ